MQIHWQSEETLSLDKNKCPFDIIIRVFFSVVFVSFCHVGVEKKVILR